MKGETKMRLKDKVALVTGGSSGMGRAASILLAREGADVIVADVNLEGAKETIALVEAEGRRGLAIKTDVSKRSEVQAMVDQAVEAFGHIDVLINNAGILESINVLDLTEAAWRKQVGVLLDGVLWVAQAVGGHMIEKGIKGAIVNTASLSVFIAFVGSAAYCAAKAGVAQLTKVMALEWAEHGIRVNAVSPGYVLTPMIFDQFKDPAKKEKWLAEIPIGRFAEPEDVAKVMVWLATDEASYVTGTNVVVDGGRMVR
jgi:NAD(P)-dependent dehydrogenase (short-subunit alcohol dehydrogenase family)